MRGCVRVCRFTCFCLSFSSFLFFLFLFYCEFCCCCCCCHSQIAHAIGKILILIEGQKAKDVAVLGCAASTGSGRRSSSTRHDDATRGHGTTQHDSTTTRHGTTRMRLATGNGQRATGDRQLGRKTGPGRQHKISPSTHSHTHRHTRQPGGMWGRGWRRRRVEGGTQGLARRTTATPPSFRAPLVVSFSLTRRHPSSIDSLTACSLTCSLSLALSLSVSVIRAFPVFLLCRC